MKQLIIIKICIILVSAPFVQSCQISPPSQNPYFKKQKESIISHKKEQNSNKSPKNYYSMRKSSDAANIKPLTLNNQRKMWAVIIGVSSYKFSDTGLSQLAFADDDANDFANMLLKLGWKKNHIKTLINEQATNMKIRIAIESWLTKAKPQDLILLYWSGHGYPDPEMPDKVYFACYDTNMNIPATGYRMDRVRDSIDEHNVKHVIILADTCHAGKIITRGSSASPFSLSSNLKKINNIPKGWIFMVSADTDRTAIESSSWSNGAFTHCLLKALSGQADGYMSSGYKDGIISMAEIKAYISYVMPDITQKVLGVAKHPIITTSTGDPGIWQLSLKKLD